MQLQVYNLEAKPLNMLTVSDNTFAVDFKEALIHQVVTAYMAGGRAGTKAQKTRSEVRGGGAKPWRQKGTGRARAGSIRSPIWRGGGVAFAAKSRDFSQKVNRKMYRSAMASIFSELLRQERLLVVEELKLSLPKTRELNAKLQQLKIARALVIIAEEDRNVVLAARNLVGVEVVYANHIDPVRLIAAEKVIITVDAVKKLEERLS